MADFVRVASLAELPVGGLLGVELDGQKIVLAHVDGAVYALEGICSHQEALLAEGSLYEECLMCPVHGGEFDARTGEAITLGEGVIYPVLHSLERNGALKSKRKKVAGRTRVYYSLNAKGGKRLERLQNEWQRIQSGISAALEAPGNA